MPPRGSLDFVIWFFHQRSHQEEGLSFIQIVVSHQCQDFASVADDGEQPQRYLHLGTQVVSVTQPTAVLWPECS